MKQETFVLRNKRTFRRGVRIFTTGQDGKITDRLLMFTTEHLVGDKERATNARGKPAEYRTKDHTEIDGLLSDVSYGKDFYLKGDEAGEMKKEPIRLTREEIEKVSLAGLFAEIGLKFDHSKPIPVLKSEYALKLEALSGKKADVSAPASISHNQVNVGQGIVELKNKAISAYKEKYREDVPEIVKNDVAFLDAMSNPNFDAQAYITKKQKTAESDAKKEVETAKENLQKEYFDKFKKNVPNVKKNDVGWIKEQLEK